MKTLILLCVLLFSATYVFAGFSLPSAGRQWYIGGKFSKVYNDNGAVDANNIAMWDGEKFAAMGAGTNGPVYAVYVDTCRTVYVGGDFTTAGGVATGPIAKWTFANKKWEPIYTGTSPFQGSGNVVYSISADCANLDFTKDVTTCNICDVFIGGKFQVSVGGKTGYNVAKFDITSKVWQDLGYGAAGSIGQNETVRAIHKKAFGITKSTKFLWVGGDFQGLRKFLLDTNAWDTTVSTDFKGQIKAIFYYPQWFSTDEIFVGGSFNQVLPGNAGTCINACQFDYANNKWSVLGANARPGPTGEVRALAVAGDSLFAAGSFVSESGSTKYVSLLKHDAATSGSWGANAVSDTTMTAINDFDVCSSTDAGCPGGQGSMALAGEGGYLKFYDAKKQAYLPFANGTNGDVNAIKSALTIANGAGAAVVQYSLFFVCALFSMLLLL